MSALNAIGLSTATQKIIREDLVSAIDRSLKDLKKEKPEYLVYRRELPVLTTQDPSSMPTWAAGRAIERTLGPFHDPFGRFIWIDIFSVVRQVVFVRSKGGVPFLTLPLVDSIFSKTSFSGTGLNLGPGSVWFASKQLALNAPVNGYTGLRIKGGTLTFSQVMSAVGSEVIVPPGVTCTLKLKLDPPATPDGSIGPGVDAREAKASVPAEVVLIFTGLGATIQKASKASIDVYGSAIKLSLVDGTPTFVPNLNRIFVTFKTDINQFAVVNRRSTMFMPDGKASITGAAWALPVAIIDPNYLGNASGAGALWFEFENHTENPNDNYFVRILSYSIDPLLVRGLYEIPAAPEPPLPIDPEPIRVIVSEQSDDYAGLNAMQRLIPSDSPRHFMVPLPPGLHEDSNELFGFFTYEIRVGHDRDKGWSTAQGRFGAALRVTGVQQPAPNLICLATRDSKGIIVSAPFTNPVYEGCSVRPSSPATEIWVLLYAQVIQADGAAWRNVLLGKKPALPFESIHKDSSSYGKASWSNDEVAYILEMLTLRQDTPLSCLAVETLPGGAPVPDPLGTNLGYQRLLRTSSLVPIPSICGSKLGA